MKQEISYKYRFYPTTEQKHILAQTFGCVRKVYNTVLAWCIEKYETNKTSINYNQTSKYLTTLKKELPYLNKVSSVALQQALRNQDKAYKNFFNKRAKFPKFKRKHGKQSFRLTNNAFSFNLDNNTLHIAKMKDALNIIWSRQLSFTPTSITISCDCANRYFVSFCGVQEIQELPTKVQAIGLDVGLTTFVATSNNEKVVPLKALLKYQRKLQLLQRKHAKKQKGSSNRNKLRLKVAKQHVKISDSRLDFLHKTSTSIVNDNQVICVEDLNIKGMVKNHKLAKHIHDASWCEFKRQLNYKASHKGRTIIEIDRFTPTDWICNTCSHQIPRQGLDVRSWQCANCNTHHDRDTNASKNILTAGLAELFNSKSGECPLSGFLISQLKARYGDYEPENPNCEVRNHCPSGQ